MREFRRPSIAAILFSAAFAAPAGAHITQRVSVDGQGHQGATGSAVASISSDGRFVAFNTPARLDPGDTGGVTDIYVRDRELGTTECASVSSTGVFGNDDSYAPSISSDGRYVAFESNATNLTPVQVGNTMQIYLRDRQLGTTVLVSVSSAGVRGAFDSDAAKISADGRFVSFESASSNLVPGDTNNARDVFVRDLLLGTTERVSVDSAGTEGNAVSEYPSISADGRYVAFASDASNLVPGDTNGATDIFVRDRTLGTTERVNVDSAGGQTNNGSLVCAISANGRYVAFDSFASNLVAGDTNGKTDIFLRDRQLGTTVRASVGPGGAQGNGESYAPSVSDDGRYVAFESFASNLVAGDTNGKGDVFVRDVDLGITERASESTAGIQGNEISETAAITSDGRFVVFQSYASNLVGADTNSDWDVFVRDRLGRPDFTSLCDPGAAGVIGCPCANPAAGANRGCDNSAGTGGAMLAAAGGSYVSSDSLFFTTSGEKPTATSVLLQGTSSLASGAVYGQGVRCVGGTLKRLFTKTASGGSITAPNLGAGDPSVSARSAAKGNPISAGESRWYLVFYRDPTVLGSCPAASTFNATQTGEIVWSP